MGVKLSLFGKSSDQKTSYDDTMCVVDVEDDYNIIISNNTMSNPINIVKNTIPNKIEPLPIDLVDKIDSNPSLPINIIVKNSVEDIIISNSPQFSMSPPVNDAKNKKKNKKKKKRKTD